MWEMRETRTGTFRNCWLIATLLSKLQSGICVYEVDDLNQRYISTHRLTP